MTKSLYLFALPCLAITLAGCFHPGKKNHPQGYCHQLRTELNSPARNNYQRSRNNAANRAVALRQYQDLDCDSQ